MTGFVVVLHALQLNVRAMMGALDQRTEDWRRCFISTTDRPHNHRLRVFSGPPYQLG